MDRQPRNIDRERLVSRALLMYSYVFVGLFGEALCCMGAYLWVYSYHDVPHQVRSIYCLQILESAVCLLLSCTLTNMCRNGTRLHRHALRAFVAATLANRSSGGPLRMALVPAHLHCLWHASGGLLARTKMQAVWCHTLLFPIAHWTCSSSAA